MFATELMKKSAFVNRRLAAVIEWERQGRDVTESTTRKQLRFCRQASDFCELNLRRFREYCPE